jgi:hypothetical protein
MALWARDGKSHRQVHQRILQMRAISRFLLYKSKDLISEAQGVPAHERGLLDTLAIDKGPIKAFKIFQNTFPLREINDGVFSRNSGIRQKDIVRGHTPDGQPFLEDKKHPRQRLLF